MSRGLKILPLTVTRRCPKSHVELVKHLIPDFEAHPDAPMGTVEYNIPINTAVQRIQEGDMVQCRTNAPLAVLCWQLIRRGLKVQIAGKDFSAQITALIDRLKASDIPDLIGKVEEYRGKELAKAEKRRNGDAFAEAVNNKCDTIIALTEGVDDIPALKKFIETIFADFDQSGLPKQSVALMSTHKAKGLEAERVWVLNPSGYPSKYATQPWQVKQENNLIVVRDTRSKDFLGYITVPGGRMPEA